MSVVDAIFYCKDSELATASLAMTAEAIRSDFFVSASTIYQNKRGFTQEQANAMTEALFSAIDRSITYRLSDAIYTGETDKNSPTTATLILYVKSIDQAAFENLGKNHIAAYSAETIDKMTAEEQQQLAYDIFIICCENVEVQGNERRISIKLNATNSGWNIEGADSLLINLFSAYTGTN